MRSEKADECIAHLSVWSFWEYVSDACCKHVIASSTAYTYKVDIALYLRYTHAHTAARGCWHINIFSKNKIKKEKSFVFCSDVLTLAEDIYVRFLFWMVIASSYCVSLFDSWSWKSLGVYSHKRGNDFKFSIAVDIRSRIDWRRPCTRSSLEDVRHASLPVHSISIRNTMYPHHGRHFNSLFGDATGNGVWTLHGRGDAHWPTETL